MSILIFFIILVILVLIHELGHFIAAKKNGVLVEEFGFGFPPRLFSIKRGETLYSINLFPIGGFVKLFGEEYQELKNKKQSKNVPGKERAFAYKKPWQKALILLGGVTGNFLLGWILISFLFTQGVPTPVNKVIVESVQVNSPASTSGIKSSDTITKIVKDGKEYPLKSVSDLVSLTKKFSGQEIVLIVEKDKTQRKVVLTPRKNPPPGQGPLGIVLTSFVEKKYSWYQAPFYGLVESFKITKHIVVELLKVVGQLVTFQKPQIDVVGPVGIAQFTGQAIKLGKNAVLELMALLSLNLAVVNILPFPALDGGRLVFVIYEWITRKRVDQKFERYLNLVGIIILLSLAVFITINDIAKSYR